MIPHEHPSPVEAKEVRAHCFTLIAIQRVLLMPVMFSGLRNRSLAIAEESLHSVVLFVEVSPNNWPSSG